MTYDNYKPFSFFIISKYKPEQSEEGDQMPIYLKKSNNLATLPVIKARSNTQETMVK